jgi:hypothetical protein
MMVERILQWRPRFGLRATFLGIAFVCVLLATWVVLARGEADFAAWDLAVRNEICENFASAPRGTATIDPTTSTPDLSGGDPAAEFEGGRVDALTTTGTHTLWSPNANYDVRDALRNESPANLAQRLLTHFESGLAERGLKRVSLSPGAICPPVVEKTTVWVSSRRDWNTTVTVQVRVDANLGEAEVLVTHFARPLF